MIVRAAFPELGLFYDTWPVRYSAILTIKVFNNNERLRGLHRQATEEETRGHNDVQRRSSLTTVSAVLVIYNPFF